MQKPGSVAELKKRYSLDHAIKRYVPSGHRDHFHTSGCVILVDDESKRRGRSYIYGQSHIPVTERNVITGLVGPQALLKPSTRYHAELYAPAGSLNQNVIDSKFTPPEKKQERLTFGFPQYSAEQLKANFRSNIEARKHNEYVNCITHSALKDLLYEVRHPAYSSMRDDYPTPRRKS